MGVKKKVRGAARRVVGEPTAAAAPVVRDAATAYRAIRDVGTAYRALAAVDDLTRFELKVFSQNGEDGILLEIMQRIGAPSKYFVEFGAGTGQEGNCVLLADVFGWTGLFIEGDEEKYRKLEAKYAYNSRVRTVRAMVTPDNVEQIFSTAGVPAEPGIVSIDIDGHDYWVFMALQSFRPQVTVIEYNSSLDPDSTLVKPLDRDGAWDGTAFFGASLGALCLGADRQGYELVHTDLAGVNAFFVRRDLAGMVLVSDPPRRAQNFGLFGGAFERAAAGTPWQDLRANGETS